MTPSQTLFRIYEYSARGLLDFSLALSYINLLIKKDVGHRLLLGVSALYFLAECSTAFGIAGHLYFRSFQAAGWVSAVSLCGTAIFAIVRFQAMDDIYTTLKVSEYTNRLNHEKKADKEQRQIFCDFLAKSNEKQSCKLVENS